MLFEESHQIKIFDRNETDISFRILHCPKFVAIPPQKGQDVSFTERQIFSILWMQDAGLQSIEKNGTWQMKLGWILMNRDWNMIKKIYVACVLYKGHEEWKIISRKMCGVHQTEEILVQCNQFAWSVMDNENLKRNTLHAELS